MAVVIAGVAGYGAPSAPTGTPGPTSTTLIDRLPEASEWGSLHSFNSYDGEGNRFWPTVPCAPDAVPEPINRFLSQLVAHGAEALPALLDHLTDARPAEIQMRSAGNSCLWLGDIYDTRYADRSRHPAGINTETVETYWARGASPPPAVLSTYTVRVGDLCFVAIGKIVNRKLNVISGTPANLIISSPVERPALAAAVRRDWSGLTPEQHARSLEHDITDEDAKPLATDALTRLCFYYPDTGEKLALRILSRSLNEDRASRPFVEKLIATGAPKRWRPMLEGFLARNGKVREIEVQRLLGQFSRIDLADWTQQPQETQAEAALNKKRGARVLKALYPHLDPNALPFPTTSSFTLQRDYVESLANIPSADLDRAVLRLFRSVADNPFPPGKRSAPDRLALACIDRLRGREQDAELSAYCQSRVADLSTRTRGAEEENDLRHFTEALRLIRERR